MACFQTKNPNFGKFWRVLQWEILVYFIAVWSILLPLGIFCGRLVYFTVIWSILLSFVYFTYCHLVYFTVIWSILLSFGTYFMAICYILWPFVIFYLAYFYRFDMLYEEKPGISVTDHGEQLHLYLK
jgi:hypothetical protein